MTLNIRDQVQSTGLSSISKTEQEIVASLNSTEELSQVDLLKLQQSTATYTSTISMMSTMLKTLADTDKEVIRNS